MVNGNYVLYGDRPSSESEIVDDHVHTRTVERKTKRKSNRTANDLQRSLNLAQKLDNETDADKYIKKIKEPRLLRYVPTTEVEENYVTEKFETYDLKPIEEPLKRYTFAKKPKNPSDGSVNYAYSRSSSSCSSPNGNLPTISEHGEQYGTYRIRSIQTPTMNEGMSYESKFDKYFARPRDVPPFSAKGSHPDSLYRVPTDGTGRTKKIVRVLRLLRWPVALFGVCVALAVFVYFLMPENLGQDVDGINATTWEQSFTEAHSYSSSVPTSTTQKPKIKQSQRPEKSSASGIKVTEIDFYDAENDTNIEISSVIAETRSTRKFPIPPVFPTHIEPEVQYGNDDVDSSRKPKILEETSAVPDDSTLRPRITQQPEKPLAIYFKDVDAVSTSTERVTTEIINKAETANISPTSTVNNKFHEKSTTNTIAQTTTRPYVPIHETQTQLPDVHKPIIQETRKLIPKRPIDIEEYYGQPAINTDVKFTSGHSKLFGISIEDSEKMKATTQSSLYNTRVSPTLPTWRDRDDTTTKNYPINALSDVPQCRSTRLPLCRGILPYDLAGAPVFVGKKEVTQLLPQIEYLVATNCSERVRHFACALLEPECSPPPYSSKLPCYNFCKAIVDNCEGYIPAELNAMFNCNQYSSSNCASARAPCYGRELACGDGSCVPRDWVCDGTKDCPGGEDETPCSACEENEFRCSSGLCIVKRWVCDGYSDCPSGDDELDKNCYTRAPSQVSATEVEEPGEESAGSAPAPSIRKPNRLPSQEARNSHYRNGESDSSKELLMTSDSTNSFKRNFTRRPSPSRLTPYSRPMPKPKKQESEEEPLIPGVITEKPRWTTYRKHFRKQQTNEKKNESSEDINMDDLGVFGNVEKEGSDQAKQSMKPEEILPATVPTRLDKSLDNLERVIDGAGLLRKAAIARKQEMADSPESNATLFETDDLGHNSAHASPCPNEELRCVDGRCITLSQLCDGTIDCSDHADEDNCYT